MLLKSMVCSCFSSSSPSPSLGFHFFVHETELFLCVSFTELGKTFSIGLSVSLHGWANTWLFTSILSHGCLFSSESSAGQGCILFTNTLNPTRSAGCSDSVPNRFNSRLHIAKANFLKQMGRAKIPIKWIPRHTSRNMTFMKRKKGLEKKVKELSILCGVEACMVCFGPQMDQQTTSDYPDVWPGKSKALEIVERYRNLSKEEQAKKKLDNSSFLEQRIKKLKVELSAKRKENRELEMEAVYSWDACLNYFTIEQLKDLVDYIDIRLENAHERMNFLSRDEREISNGARQQMEDGGSYNSMMPYQSGHDSSGSTLDHLKPYPSLEGHYKELMSSCETVAMDYSKANPPFIRAFNDYHAPNYKEGMDNGEDDRMAVCNAHLMVNESFPLLGIDGVNPIQSSTGSCSQWCRTITPCSLHNPSYSTCPQHDGMNPTIQQVQFSYEPHYQQWLDEMMESQAIQRVLGDEGINFQNDSSVRPTPLLLNRSLGSNDHCYIKNIF